MKPPIPPSPEAQRFWDRHAERLHRAKILTESDLDAFWLLCETWSMLAALKRISDEEWTFREAIQFNNLLKQFHAYAKQFGLLPRERKASKMETEPAEEKDEFDI